MFQRQCPPWIVPCSGAPRSSRRWPWPCSRSPWRSRCRIRSSRTGAGWPGPARGSLCALVTARVVGLPVAGTLVGAALAGLPSLVAVVLGVHWLGAVLAIALFALWCARLARDRGPRGARRLASRPWISGLDGKVALVTGASKGIGRGIAAELVAEGARVAISSHSRERVEATGGRDRRDGVRARHRRPRPRGGAGRRGRRRRSARSTSSSATPAGRPAAPTPSASRASSGRPPTRRSSSARWRSSRPCVPGMRERGFGRVLNVASTGVREPIPNLMLSNAHRISMLNAFKTHRPPGRGRRRDPQHRPPRPHRHRPPGRAARLREAAVGRRRAGGPRRPPGHASRSSRPSPCCSARRARATSRARRSRSTAGCCARCSERRATAPKYPQGESNSRCQRERLVC